MVEKEDVNEAMRLMEMSRASLVDDENVTRLEICLSIKVSLNKLSLWTAVGV